MRFNVGIIGATGYIGVPYREEIRASPQDAAIVALCARRRDRLEAAARQDGAAFITQDWREVVRHPDVNLVLVLTPDAHHYEPVLECARLGKHVVCEKPVGMNVQQAHEMWNAYRDSGLGHFVPFWTRYVDLFVRAREIVRGGQLGDIKAIIYRWHTPRPESMPFTWREDASLSAAGTIADVGTHAYDVVRWIIDDESQRVFAHAGAISEPKPDLGAIDLKEALDWAKANTAGTASAVRQGTAPDYASIAVEFRRGAVGVFVLSHARYLRKGLASELELHGTEGSIGFNRFDGKLQTVHSDGKVETLDTLPDRGLGNRFAKHVFPALRARIAGEPTDHPGLEDGWRAQIFADAAAFSARRGGWVDIGELPTA